jgi:hypothetical protein
LRRGPFLFFARPCTGIARVVDSLKAADDDAEGELYWYRDRWGALLRVGNILGALWTLARNRFRPFAGRGSPRLCGRLCGRLARALPCGAQGVRAVMVACAWERVGGQLHRAERTKGISCVCARRTGVSDGPPLPMLLRNYLLSLRVGGCGPVGAIAASIGFPTMIRPTLDFHRIDLAVDHAHASAKC